MPSLGELRRRLREGKAIRRFANEAVEIERAPAKKPVNDRMMRRLAELKEKAKTRSKAFASGRYRIAADGADAILHFGKHKGKQLSDIMKEEPGYVVWLIENFEEEALIDVARYVREKFWADERKRRAKAKER